MQDNESIESSPSESNTGVPQLPEVELRVLGVLMEKQLTTPDAYPLTLNSIITACNQKSSREPITNYDHGEVQRALNVLVDKNFVRKEFGSRSDKYSQQFIAHLDLGKKHQALLCIMMLRGPQTLSELFTRTQRMNLFGDKDDVNHCIGRLCERDVPYAMHLGTPGQRGERVAHLFSGIPEYTASAPATSSNSGVVSLSEDDANKLSVMELDVASLRDTVRLLEQENRSLQHKIETLYGLTGNTLPEEVLPTSH